jgi:transketolase
MTGKDCCSTLDGFREALLRFDGDDLFLCERACEPDRFEAFSERSPHRYVQGGFSEAELVLTALGLALAGFRTVVASTASFLVGKAYDQIRHGIALPRLSLCLAGTGSGLSLGEEGAPSQMLEDLTLMRALPGMTVLVPCDGPSASALTLAACRGDGPVYLRLSHQPRPVLYGDGDGPFTPGEGRLLREGREVTLCACGVMVHEALRAAEILSQQGLSPEVIDCYSIKPLPEQLILSSVRRTGCCVVAEEHGSSGGLCGALAEMLSQHYPVPLRFVTAGERFGQSGTTANLQEYYGLTYKEIVGAAAQAWAMRRR